MITLEEWCKLHNRMDILKRWSDENNCRPSDLSFGSTKKVIWRCEEGHTWITTPNKITGKSSSGCPYCANQKVWKEFNDLQTQKPEIAIEWHPTKNGSLMPDEITVHSNKKIWWLCPEKHEYEATVAQRTRENRRGGCPYCANKRVFRGFNDLKTTCPEVAAEWHPTKNGNLKPSDVLPSINKKIWWLCSLGHEYQATLNSRVINGRIRSGCPICANKRILIGFNDLASQHPKIASEWNYQKNGDTKPSMVISGAHTKYWWICPFGHEYLASPDNRTKVNGTGCPICASEHQSSFPEQAIFFYLKQQFPEAKNRAVVFGQEIDIYLEKQKIGIEYDGKRFHTKETQNKELKKDSLLLSNGIRVIRVKEYTNNEDVKDLTDVIWVNERNNQYKNIEFALKKILHILNCHHPVFLVDLNKDSIAIMEMYISSRKENSLSKLRPEIASEWNYERNGGITPEMVSVGSGKKVWWMCSHGHEYQMSVDARTGKNTGCPFCAGQKIMTGFNDLKTRYPDIAKEWHTLKNGELTPDKIMPGSRKKVWWRCSANHNYLASVASRTNSNSGCPYCAGRLALPGETDLQTIFPQIAKEWDYQKNLLTPDKVKPYSHIKVWWICPNGHSYQTAISNRTTNSNKWNSNGCPFCSGTKTLAGFNDLETRFPELAKRWHPTLNGTLSPNNVSPFSTKKAWWQYGDKTKFQRIDSVVSNYLKQQKANNQKD